MKSKKLIISLLLLAVFLIGACAQSKSAEIISAEPVAETDLDPKESQPIIEEQLAAQAPAVSPDWYSYDLTDINTGMVFRIEDYSGKVVLVETMAVWCSNCLKQQQEVAKLHELIGNRGDLISIGINIDPNENVNVLSEYVRNNGFDWRYVVASDQLINDISDLYGSQYLNPPSTPMLIIDRYGGVHQLPFRVKSAESLLTALQPFLDESV